MGAPIQLWSEYYKTQEHDFKLDTPIPCKHFTEGYHAASCPTAEQMLGWLEEQKDIEEIFVQKNRAFHSWACLVISNEDKIIFSNNIYRSRKESTIAAIDAALEYLKSTKQE